MSTHLPNCDACGRFHRPDKPGASWVFVPDTPFTHEEVVNRCATCTEAHGRPMPSQSVRVESCSGAVATHGGE